jgi:hypothetical protein
MNTKSYMAGALRIWWVPQVPMKPFYRDVADLSQAKLLLETLADYDAFQFENKVKGDYCNVGGFHVFEDGEWSDWYDEETGDDFDEWMR